MKSHRIPWNIGIMEDWNNGEKERSKAGENKIIQKPCF
jgi:hypothetical protein